MWLKAALERPECMLAVLVGAEDLNLFPSILEMKLAMKAAGVLVSVHSFPLCNVATPALQWRICG